LEFGSLNLDFLNVQFYPVSSIKIVKGEGRKT
jgi:hypothetical protein